MSEPLLVTHDSGITTLTLNRPAVHNAFNETLISSLYQALQHYDKDPQTRVVVLAAVGSSFCAGADLQWMSKMAQFSKKENHDDAIAFAKMLAQLAKLTKPTVALVQGDAYGGGIGIIAACDIAIASEKAQFCFSEVKLGLIPAVISPYIVSAMGARTAKRLFLTAERFTATQAMQYGLLADITSSDNLAAEGTKLTTTLCNNGPQAMILSKQLVTKVQAQSDSSKLLSYTADMIANCRVSAEGQEGVAAFIAKRSPRWE